MRYWAAIGVGLVAALVMLTYGPRRNVDLSSKPRTATVITVGPNGSITHVDVVQGQANKPRAVTFVVAALAAVTPVGWMFVTRRSRQDE